MSNSECGVACLRMILAYFGRWVDPQLLRDGSGMNRDGTNARSLLQVAREQGLRTSYATSVDPEDLRGGQFPAILHWDYNHFVIVEKINRNTVTIVDPNNGRARLTFDELSLHFTGVVLFFEPSEIFERQRRSRATLKSYLAMAAPHGRIFGSVLLLTFLAQLLTIAIARVTQVVIDDMLPSRDFNLLYALVLGLGFATLLQAWMILVRWRLLTFFRTRMDLEMTLRFFSHLVRLPYAFFQQRSSGDLALRLSSTSQIREIFSDRLMGALLDAAMLVVLAVALIVASPIVGIAVVILGGVRIGIVVGIRRRQRDLMRRGLHAQAKAQSRAVEIVNGIHAIKAGGAERRWFERWRTLFIDQLNVTVDLSRIQGLADALISATSIASPAIVLFLGAREVVFGHMSVGDLVAFAALAGAFTMPLLSLSSTWSSWEMAGQHLDRISEVLEHPPESGDGRPVVLGGSVALENVSFSYGAGAVKVLDRVSLTIPSGSYVAIVGPSGSGKSTLAKLLLSLHVPTEGRVLYDGDDITGVDLTSLRQQVGTVVQDVTLMSGTIRDFITDGEVVPESVLYRAAQVACFHDEIAAMPLGYDTVIAENGANLSGGQKQRMAIARAVLAKPSIILFDEATSAVDNLTEARIHDNLAALHCTRIVISHRFATIRNVARVYVLDHGRVMEEGAPDDLLLASGLFSRMFNQPASAPT